MSGRGAFAYLCTCLNLDGDRRFDFAVRNRRAEYLRTVMTIAQLGDGAQNIQFGTVER